MEKERGSKLIAVIALVLAVAGLSIGFAAFSSTLNITTNSNVSVSGDNWDVGFSPNGSTMAAKTTAEASTITGSGVTNAGTMKLMKYTLYPDTAATISTTANEAVTYSFYIKNAGNIDAVLDSISFGSLTCAYNTSASDRTIDQDASNVGATQSATSNGTISNADCATMFNVKLTIDGTDYTPSSSSFNNTITHGQNVAASLTITSTGSTPTTLPTGDFVVTLGATTVNYKSA
jgi:hypothetical protein